MSKKDNPVPSLDSDINIFLSKHEYLFAFREDKKHELRKKIKKLLQNGVETNNEQPKKHCNTHWYSLMCDKCRKEYNRLMR